MSTSLRLMLAAMAAVLLLAFGLGTASARNLSITIEKFKATWRSLEFVSEFVTIRCPVTLEGSFSSRTIAKVLGLLIGPVNRAVVKQEACTNGRVAAFNGSETYNGSTTSNTLPWHISFEVFFGRLPAIESVSILFSRFRFGVTAPGLCTGQYGTAENRILFSLPLNAGGEVTGITPVAGSNTVNLLRTDSGICPTTGRLAGSGSIAEPGGITIKIRLI